MRCTNPKTQNPGFGYPNSSLYIRKPIPLQQEWQLSNEQVAEYKEVFMLFDKDEDGVLSFPELTVVMKSLGQRPSGKHRNIFFSRKKIYVCIVKTFL